MLCNARTLDEPLAINHPRWLFSGKISMNLFTERGLGREVFLFGASYFVRSLLENY